MNMTDLRVFLYAALPVAAVIFPWVEYADGVVTIQFNVEVALASAAGAGAAVASIYAKWGKRV